MLWSRQSALTNHARSRRTKFEWTVSRHVLVLIDPVRFRTHDGEVVLQALAQDASAIEHDLEPY